MDAAGDKLTQDIRELLATAEKLFGASAAESAEHFDEMRGRTEEQIRAHPFTAVGIAAAVGLVLGILLTRK